MSGIGYKIGADGTTAIVTDKEGNPIGEAFKGVCYGGILGNGYTPSPIITARNDENAFYLDVYYSDNVTKHYKNDTTVTNKFLDALASTSLYRNSSVSLITIDEMPKQVANGKLYTNYILRIRHELDKASAQEMFLIGLAIRTAAIQPQIVVDYVKLLELEPEVDKWQLFLLAHCVSFEENREECSGHRLVSNYFSMLNDYTLDDFYKRAEHKTNLRKATNYRLDNYSPYENLFIKNVDIKPKDGIYYERYGVKSLYEGTAARRGVIYSKEATKTFFDLNAFREALCTKAFSCVPFISKDTIQPTTKRVDSYVEYETNAFLPA